MAPGRILSLLLFSLTLRTSRAFFLGMLSCAPHEAHYCLSAPSSCRERHTLPLIAFFEVLRPARRNVHESVVVNVHKKERLHVEDCCPGLFFVLGKCCPLHFGKPPGRCFIGSDSRRPGQLEGVRIARLETDLDLRRSKQISCDVCKTGLCLVIKRPVGEAVFVVRGYLFCEYRDTAPTESCRCAVDN